MLLCGFWYGERERERERESSEERNKREESHNEKREINGRLTGFRDQIGQF